MKSLLFLIQLFRERLSEGWYGQPKYCYKKTIHVVLNQRCTSLCTSRFLYIYTVLVAFGLSTFNSNRTNQKLCKKLANEKHQHSLYFQPGSTKYWRSVLNTLIDAINNKFTPLQDDAHPLPWVISNPFLFVFKTRIFHIHAKKLFY